MNELIDAFPKTPGWSIVLVLVLLIFGPAAIFSRESAEKLWIIGRAVAWLRTRQQRSIDRERALEEATVRHLKGRIASLDSQMGEMRADFDEERKDARKRETAIREEFNEAKDYIVWATGWAHQVLTMHASHGWKPPIPPWMTFEQWQATRRDND
ncbi:hypothetical protein [Corynebacterium sp. HMSC28B08]|uniref:hypothetical protein n=1 Tax=Corynebacterium sp. HMSC28B08 TaxID=1581066 RepID=UPI0008A63C91|nr:hypothetical protein [Corynebacterium sp. HMSC28B08]OFT91396.1 hypothetical protein HMPREF3098_01170 [Corynebacterium sp. HMSC28B08]